MALVSEQDTRSHTEPAQPSTFEELAEMVRQHEKVHQAIIPAVPSDSPSEGVDPAVIYRRRLIEGSRCSFVSIQRQDPGGTTSHQEGHRLVSWWWLGAPFTLDVSYQHGSSQGVVVHVSDVVDSAASTAGAETGLSSWEKALDPSIRISLNRLIEVYQETDAEDGTRVTAYALDRAWSLMLDAWKEMRSSFRKASPGPGPDGGIRVQWRRSEKEIRLVVPPRENGQTYIYHESGDDYGSEERVTARSLVHWLRWLTRDE